jgi:hypothetical protein
MDVGMAIVATIVDESSDMELQYWSISTLFIFAARGYLEYIKDDRELKLILQDYAEDTSSWSRWGKNEAKDLLEFI